MKFEDVTIFFLIVALLAGLVYNIMTFSVAHHTVQTAKPDVVITLQGNYSFLEETCDTYRHLDG